MQAQRNPIVWACITVRLLVFSEVRFAFQQWQAGRPGNRFGTPELQILETPWPQATTGDLLARMEVDASMYGNSYWVRDADQLVRLDPTRVAIATTDAIDQTTGNAYGKKLLGYFLNNERGQIAATFLPGEVAHYRPVPDPAHEFRGASWLNALLPDVIADLDLTDYKHAFLQNAAPQPMDAKILTPTGWSAMGDMTVGGQVIGSDGKAHDVIGVYPQGEQDIYRVGFSDGTSAECTYDHVWQVASAYDRRQGTSRVLSLRALVEGDGLPGTGSGRGGLHMPSGSPKWSVPFVSPVEFADDGPLPLHPYLLGALLGDGSFRATNNGSGGVSLASAIGDVEETCREIEPMLPPGVSISRRDRGGWAELYFSSGQGPGANPLTALIKSLGLWDHLGADKFIPEVYMRGSVNDRISILQGLIDTDGSVGLKQGNCVRFSNTSHRLCEDLVELVRSLGGTASIKRNQRGTNHPQWTVIVRRLPEWIIPCRLSRKTDRYTPQFVGGRYRYITHVEKVRRAEAQCIRVDVDDSLYVTDDYILTHNTPNLVVQFTDKVSQEAFNNFRDKMESAHTGPQTGFKTLYVGAGVDVKTVGSNFADLAMNAVQSAGETRIAAAAGVPPGIVGLSEALKGSTLNAGNYAATRRRFSDGTMRPLWRSASGALATLLKVPPGSRLSYEERDVMFLQEDVTDAATIRESNAKTINTLIGAGFEPTSVVAAVETGDMTLLKHTGLVSVQLQAPGRPLQPGDVSQPDPTLENDPSKIPLPAAPTEPDAAA